MEQRIEKNPFFDHDRIARRKAEMAEFDGWTLDPWERKHKDVIRFELKKFGCPMRGLEDSERLAAAGLSPHS